MPRPSNLLVERCDTILGAQQTKDAQRTLKNDRALQKLVSELAAARVRIGFTQAQVAELMPTTKSVVSRLESGRCTRPTFSTIERYALAVGCRVEVKLRSLW